MDRIYHHDDTMYVAGTKVYVSSKNDGFAYADSKCTEKIKAEVLERLFYEGLIIVDSTGVSYKPISCKVAAKVATIAYATTDSSTTTAAKLATVKSEG